MILPNEIRQLSVPERLQLLEDIWDSILEEEETLQESDLFRAELDRRIALHKQDPSQSRSWREFRQSPEGRD
jgi:putative addiction module component (TIGR02574 family)